MGVIQMTGGRHDIFEDLDRLHRINALRRLGEPGETCPIYSPSQPCVRSKCLWFDATDMTCWVLSPKPKKAKG